jgi:hypothetical protein
MSHWLKLCFTNIWAKYKCLPEMAVKVGITLQGEVGIYWELIQTWN